MTDIDVTTDNFVDTRTASAFLGVAESTMKQWRQSSKGPKWIKMEKSVRYRVSDLNTYLQACSEAG